MERTTEHDGCRLAYEIQGSGPRVLFIQGVGVPGGGWRPQTDGLKARCSCLTFDNRGLGRSVPTSKPVTVERMVADTLAVLDAAGWDSAHVVGHSLGGLVALHLALAARNRVRSLSLLCTFPNGRAAAPLTFRMAWLGMRSRIGSKPMRRRGFLGLILPPSADTGPAAVKQLTELFGRDLADQPPIVGEQLRAMRTAPILSLAPLAGLPTLVVNATYDPIAPPSVGRSLAESIPRARFVEETTASHALPITHADLTNQLLWDHLSAAETELSAVNTQA